MAIIDIIIAGGGGGNAGSRDSGDGGGLIGADGSESATGGTQSAGGSGETVDCVSGDGSKGQGGAGCSSGSFGGGGGGGGYYGGGGGSSDSNNAFGGAGGSSYTETSATNVIHTQGENTGNGEVLIYDTSDNLLKTFSYQGSEEEWTIPSGHTSIKIIARGAEGGETEWGSSGTRGRGGKVEATYPIGSGVKLYVRVGQYVGESPSGGYGGGGVGGVDNYSGGGGGGGTFIATEVETVTVTASAATSITSTTADANGEITATGGEDATERGFVYDTVSRLEPTDSYTLVDTESFETSLGDWVNDAGNVSDWLRNSGGTASNNTGPSSASAGTYYIYVETSSAASYTSGDTDIIEYTLSGTVGGYVEFDYHQYGDDQGTLYLEAYDGSTWNVIWSSTGEQGNQWNSVAQASTEFISSTKIRFRNVAAGSFNGDIALDNIKVYEGDPTPYTSVENETGTFGIGTYTLGLTGLTETTTYYVRAYAKNSAGYSYSSSEVSFATPTASAFNIADATFSKSIATQDADPQGMAWNGDGSKMYEIGRSSVKIYEYDVSTPYDIDTAVFSQSVSTQDSGPTGMAWNGDGSKLYEIGSVSDKIYEYDVTPTPTATITGASTITGISTITF